MFKLIMIVFLFSAVCEAEIIFPIEQKDLKGEVTDQDLNSVYSLEQYGDDDNWDSYLEFYPNKRRYKGIFLFNSPVSDNGQINSIQLLANYRGAEFSYQQWEIKLRDFQARKWVYLSDNSAAQSWQWYQMQALISDNPQRFVNADNQIKLLYQSNNDHDASQLDFLSLDIQAVEQPVVEGDTQINTEIPNDNVTTWWQPAIGLNWQVQYAGELDYTSNFDVFNVDLFDTPVEEIANLKSQGKHIVCYFSAGSTEDWRDDFSDFPSIVIGHDYEGWAGEAWLDISRQDILLPLMQARIALAAEKGCDAVDPDNTNGYANNTGFNLSYADQISYNKALAELAHQAGLAIGLKNDLEQINDLVAYFDFAINESCFEYDECHLMNAFIEVGKPVVAIDYNVVSDSFCVEANQLNFDGIKKNWDLDAWLYSCR